MALIFLPAFYSGPHHGHYISIIKALGSWLVFDDDNVYPIAEKDIPKYYGDSNAGSAYVLYYEAVDIDRTNLGLRTPPLPTPSAASVPPSPSQVNPALPPGLTDEADSSDLSDPPFPVTPAQSSPLLSPSRPALDLKVAPLNGVPPASPASPALTASPANGKAKGLFPTLRRTPSTKAATSPESSRTVVESVPPSSPLPSDDASTTKLIPNRNRTPSPVLPTSHSFSERTEIVEKKGWFGKRKSIRITEKKESEGLTPTPKADDPATMQTTSTSSSNASSHWYKHNDHARNRRPSEPSSFNANTLASPRSSRPKSTVDGSLTVKPPVWAPNGRETPPGSATSSTGSGSNIASSAPAPSHMLNHIPARKSSLIPDAPPKSPDRKKSFTSLPRLREKPRKSIDSPRPSTAPGNTENISLESPPPVPPIPPIISSNAIPDGHALPTLEKGKMREGSPVTPLTSVGSYPTAPGLHTSGANHSTSSTGSGTASNLKRASRKLSISGGMFGFGKKDKERREREREEGKGPPSSFYQH